MSLSLPLMPEIVRRRRRPTNCRASIVGFVSGAFTTIDRATVVSRSWRPKSDRRPIRLAHVRNLAFPFLFVLLIDGCASSSIQNSAVACSNNLDSPIPNFCVVTPDVLWRGAKPAEDGAAWLMQHRVRTIVNLELFHDDRRVFGQTTLADANRYEAGYFRIPDWEPNAILARPLLDNHVAHFLAVVSEQPKPIYVHCRSGQNRTGLMIAAYRVFVEGASADEAIEEMRRYQGWWFETDSGYIRGLSPERRREIRRKVIEWIPDLKRDSRIVCENGKCDVFKD